MSPLALEARCALALSRVLAAIDPARATTFEHQALDLVADLAWRLPCTTPPPTLFQGEALLLSAFAEAQYEADRTCVMLEANPPPVWMGSWSVSLDGRFETRPCVAHWHEDGGFRAGLLVSFMGGDCLPGYGDPVAMLDEAIHLARQREAQWHAADGG